MGTIIFHNTVWGNGVAVDTRMGNNSPAEANPPSGQMRIGINASWSLDSPNNLDVWWRRESNPDNPNGNWLGWNRQMMGVQSPYNIDVL